MKKGESSGEFFDYTARARSLILSRLNDTVDS